MVNKGVVFIGDVSGNLASITTSGQIKVDATVTATANISGQPVQISGQTVVANVVTNISGQTVYLPNNGVNNVVSISGQTVVANVVTNISGQAVVVSGATIYFINDGVNNVVQISGQTVVGSFTASVSGQPVRISGETVTIAGGINVSGSPVRISGETIYFIDDSVRNKVKVSGQLVAVSGIVAINSLPVISISGNAIRISGQTVSLTPGTNILVSGEAVRISGSVIYLIDDSVNNKVKISGQLVAVSGIVTINNASLAVTLPAVHTSGNAARISGQTIYLIDDSINNKIKISGQLVAVSGIVNIGNNLTIATLPVISVSGNLVAVSGIVGVNSLPVISVSGNAVRLTNDSVNNVVRISGETIRITDLFGLGISIIDSTNTSILTTENALVTAGLGFGWDSLSTDWQKLRVTASGDGNRLIVSISGQPILISGQTVVTSVTTNISGQTTYLPNDGINNVVWISGQVVTATVQAGPTNISGQVVYFVDNGVNNVVKISGQTVVASVTTNISGQSVRLPNDGVNNVVSISGQLVVVSGTVSISPAILVSGEAIRFTNDSVNNVVRMSGQLVAVSGVVTITPGTTLISGESIKAVAPSIFRTRALLACAQLSGGTQLLSGDVRKATLINAGVSGTEMYVGSTTDPPFSGFGIYLTAGNGITIEVNNFNVLRVCAFASGQRVSYGGEQY